MFHILKLIQPSFGAISICDSYLGEPVKEHLLDRYDKNGVTLTNDKGKLIANLQLSEMGFVGGFVELAVEDGKVSGASIVASFSVPAAKMKSYVSLLTDYLREGGFFDETVEDDGYVCSYCFRNALNAITFGFFDEQIHIELTPSSKLSLSPGPRHESGAIETVARLVRGEKDCWPEYYVEKLKESFRPGYKAKIPTKQNTDNDVQDALTGATENEEVLLVWLEFVAREYKSKPRLQKVLEQAKAYTNEDDDIIIVCQVGIQSQKDWFESNVLEGLQKGFEKEYSSRVIEIICTVKSHDNPLWL